MQIQKVFLKPDANVYEETTSAILSADLIVIGPGDLYTSLIPNILVKGIPEALRESTAKKVFICNLMSKWGETHDYNASDIAKEMLAYSGLPRFDYVVCNTAEMDTDLVQAYAKENKYPITCDERLKEYAANVIIGDFFSEADIARHDSVKVAKVISGL
jgi:uncharacterized cofD-like protein